MNDRNQTHPLISLNPRIVLPRDSYVAISDNEPFARNHKPRSRERRLGERTGSIQANRRSLGGCERVAIRAEHVVQRATTTLLDKAISTLQENNGLRCARDDLPGCAGTGFKRRNPLARGQKTVLKLRPSRPKVVPGKRCTLGFIEQYRQIGHDCFVACKALTQLQVLMGQTSRAKREENQHSYHTKPEPECSAFGYCTEHVGEK